MGMGRGIQEGVQVTAIFSRNVTIVTPWRQHADDVLLYERRIAALDYPQDRLRMAFLENDSTDSTYGLLESWAGLDQRITLEKRDTGGALYGSIINADRFRIMGTVFNFALELVDYDWSDYVLFLPCDIRFGPDLLTRLLAHQAPVVSPFVYQNGIFYDIWAFSRNGHNFLAFGENRTEPMFGTRLLDMDTIGGVTLIDCDVLRAGVRYSTENVDRGFCEAARAKGFSIHADPTLHVYHGL